MVCIALVKKCFYLVDAGELRALAPNPGDAALHNDWSNAPQARTGYMYPIDIIYTIDIFTERILKRWYRRQSSVSPCNHSISVSAFLALLEILVFF